MPKLTKRLSESHKKRPEEAVPLAQAIEVLKSYKPTKFDQSVEIHMRLGIDAKQADQIVRGSIVLYLQKANWRRRLKRQVPRLWAKKTLQRRFRLAGWTSMSASQLPT